LVDKVRDVVGLYMNPVVSEKQNEGKVCNAGRLSARGGELYRRDLGE
jgi:hypothetical protein